MFAKNLSNKGVKIWENLLIIKQKLLSTSDDDLIDGYFEKALISNFIIMFLLNFMPAYKEAKVIGRKTKNVAI